MPGVLQNGPWFSCRCGYIVRAQAVELLHAVLSVQRWRQLEQPQANHKTRKFALNDSVLPLLPQSLHYRKTEVFCPQRACPHQTRKALTPIFTSLPISRYTKIWAFPSVFSLLILWTRKLCFLLKGQGWGEAGTNCAEKQSFLSWLHKSKGYTVGFF